MKKYITEFIGTFFLVTVVGLTAVASPGAGPFAPIAIGATLMVMIYAGGHISGAHYNPAVTLAVFVRGKINISDAVTYVIAQIGGALMAWAIVSFIFEGSAAIPSNGVESIPKALAGEFLGTFALAYVVLNTATAKGTDGNSFYGLAIGFTVVVSAYAFGSFSGGAFNPAVAIGATMLKAMTWADSWIYLAGCLGGGLLAGIVFKMNNPDDK